MKTTVVSTALLVALGACGAKENKEVKKDTPTAAANKIIDAKPAETKPTDAKPTDAKPADAKPAEIRTTLLPIDDKDLKCSSTETKITELIINKKPIDVSKFKESHAYFQNTTQNVVLSTTPIADKEKYQAVFFDRKTLKKGEVFLYFVFNRNKDNTQIAPELGAYKSMPDDPNNVFNSSAQVYTQEAMTQIAATKVVLEGISTTRVCGTFEFENFAGANTLKGTFNVPNTVR